MAKVSIDYQLQDYIFQENKTSSKSNYGFQKRTQPELPKDRKPPQGINELLDVIQKLSLAKDLETIMYIVRTAARKLTGADGATFVLRDNDKCYYADEDAIAPLWKGKRFPMKICISGWVMLNRRHTIIPDIYADARIPADAYRPTFVKSLAMVPIRTEEPLGAIGAYWADYHTPTEDEVGLLKALADSTSVAMANIQLHSELALGSQQTSAQYEITKKLMETNQYLESTLKELHHRNKQMKGLKELSSSLQTCLYIDEAYKLIGQHVSTLLPHTSGVLYIMHPSRNYLEAVISWGHPLSDEKIIKPDECLALRKGSLYEVKDPLKELVCSHCKTHKEATSYSCFPLFAQSDTMGLFYLECEKASNKKKQQTIIPSMVAEQIAIGIFNIKLRETLRNLSFRDALTSLYNRRYLEETLEREMSRCARKSLPLAVFMLDIDHFKQFNDKFGHEAGDMVLQALGNVLRDFARKDDIACRYGGEEFIFVMPEMDMDAASKRAQELHEAIRKIHLRYGGNALTQITISIGLAVFPLHAENKHDLVAAADIALYQAKNTGRDKTVVYKNNMGKVKK